MSLDIKSYAFFFEAGDLLYDVIVKEDKKCSHCDMSDKRIWGALGGDH